MLKIISGILQREHRVLLGLRKNTSAYPDYWAFPAGHLESGESSREAMTRELFEELGIEVITAAHLCTLTDPAESIQHFVYRVTDWRGEPRNLEPEVCAGLGWFCSDQLPEPLTPATQTIFDLYIPRLET